MVIQIKTAHAGNLALQVDRFDLPVEVAKMVTLMMSTPGGPWWHLKSTTRKAVRAKQPVVKIFTSGFGSQQLASTLSVLGHTTNCTIFPGDIVD